MSQVRELTADLLREASVLNRTYYHATYLEDAEKIAKTGFRINRARGRGKVLGAAVYVTADKSFSAGYGEDINNDEGKDAGMLHLRLNVSKFLDVNPKTWSDEVKEAYVKAGGRLGGQVNYPALGEVAVKLGFQAAGHAPGNVAVFDPKNIKVVKVEPMRV